MAPRFPTDPAERFRAQATAKVNAALRAIKKIGGIATSRNRWTDEQIEKIREALEAEVAEALKEFEKKPKAQKQPLFSF